MWQFNLNLDLLIDTHTLIQKKIMYLSAIVSKTPQIFDEEKSVPS